jgi:2-methylisocitrate lyase-like PEP mutase family enzyme
MTRRLFDLHQSGTFVLVNVHDVGSAAIAQHAGAQALGTTSGGHAYSIGRRDAAGELSREESIERASEICAAVDIPVSVDAENGWGHEPEDVAETVRLLIECGLAGASIEDWSGETERGFYERSLAVARIEAAVEAANTAETGFVICARADRVMHEGMDAFEDTLSRLQSFAAVGAGCLYAPGVSGEVTIGRVIDEAGGPVNVLLGMNSGLSIPDVSALGARRISLGSSLYQATMGAFCEMVKEALTTGSLNVATPVLDYDLIESLF